MSAPVTDKTWVHLTPRERRVLGVLVEKAKTTPEYYPMTIAALMKNTFIACEERSGGSQI